MWICENCGEEITKDKYKNCWNCGQPKPQKDEPQKVVERIAPPRLEPTVRLKPPVEIKPSARFENKTKTETSATKSKPSHESMNTPAKASQTLSGEEFLSQYEPAPKVRSSSIIGKFIQLVLWLGAVSAVGYFAYSSYQKTQNFERKIAEDFQSFNKQREQFVFPQLPQMRRGTVIEGNIKPKVLPINLKTKEIDSLFFYLPDDLRPENIEQIKTLMWLDCENDPVGKYRDGTTGYREKCKAYLVDKETSKFVGIEDFLGVMPALAKEREGEDAIGKVFSEKYVAFLREKQPEAERGMIQSSSESPSHHIYTKSEFIYALLILGLLTAIGFGWLAYNLRFSR